MTAVVLGWTVLAAGVLLIGPRILILVALAAAVATVLDLMGKRTPVKIRGSTRRSASAA
jgi:hypothetical protein